MGPAPLLLFIFIWGWCNESICALTRELCGELIKMLFRFSLTERGVEFVAETFLNNYFALHRYIKFKLAHNKLDEMFY